MDDIDVDRSIHFVSLDTHPANNALVVTYEIRVSLVDCSSGREIVQRSKRDQLQVHFSALDRFEEEDLRADKLVINLHELSAEVVRKCPLLLTERHNFEDIQLHLLYLINRRQSQLLCKSDETLRVKDRPPSAASIRLRSRHSANSRLRKDSALSSDSSDPTSNVYSYLKSKETGPDDTLELYINELDEHLNILESSLMSQPKARFVTIDQLEVLLESLYGDRGEKLVSMVSIRKLSKNNEDLWKISSNRLLICAMLRTLRDTKANEEYLSEAIFYCLIRFTSFQDIYKQVFDGGDPINLMKLVLELLEQDNTKLSSDRYYYTSFLLIILENLFKLGLTITAQQANQLATLLSDLLQFTAKNLTKEIRLSGKLQKTIGLLSLLIRLLLHLSMFREFINSSRKQKTLVDTLISLINTLQSSRPGSGGLNNELTIISNKQTLNQFYDIEMNVFKFINNLLFDNRLKLKLIKKGLLKCVLRNLVVFLASQNTSSVFDQSSVLKVPFKCLCELSCDSSIKAELYRSKIIMKCLLEYLLSSAMNLEFNTCNDQEENLSDSADQIVLKPNSGSQYIVCTWLNLSAKKEATFYTDNDELFELIMEYIELAINKLRAFISTIGNRKQRLLLLRGNQLMIYLHLKLIRNLTQFLEFKKKKEIYGIWMEQIGEAAIKLVSVHDKLTPLTVECLATLTNLISKCTSPGEARVPQMSLLVERLSKFEAEDLDGENDDLLLVSVMFIATLAKEREICPEMRAMSSKIISTSNMIFESKATDNEMILSCLYALSQLMNHGEFLMLANEQLVNKLASLMLHADNQVSKLATLILDRYRQFEAQKNTDFSISSERFSVYNGKWLAAIRASREEFTGNLDEDTNSAAGFDGEEDEDDQLGQLRTVEEEESMEKRSRRQKWEEDFSDDEEEDDDEAEDSFETPDLNVIDANSMIKHLTSRREFRCEWLNRR